MSQEEIKALVRFRMEQAEESLGAAEVLLNSGYLRETISRSYYAMFYTVLALLAIRKRETSRHQGAIVLFDLEFVKPGEFSKDFSEWLHAAFNMRLRSDYSPVYHPSREDAELAMERARQFVAGVRENLKGFLSQ